MSGSNLANSVGHVGTQGTSDPGNFPASRKGAGSWTDGDGNLWLFGGDAAEVTDPSYFYNNLWKYSPSTNEWTWVGGTIRVNGAGVYGMQGVPDPTNVPGARSNAVAWTDHSGNVWLFGGGIPEGCMNDLWKYSKGEWTWMGGSKGANQSGTYGTQGTAATGNYPGARCDGSAGWTDASGNLWLFGGSGFDSTGTAGQLNDLWKFDGSHWAWAGGSKSTSQPGRYGALGKASATGFPGARMFSVSWSDASGNLWLFGGIGLDSTGMGGDLNDLWEYQP
jgi:N-acetylneuraminic acid mutarotase